MELVFATNNDHKLVEIRKVLPHDIKIISLREAGIDIDIPEPHDSLEANAHEKCIVIHQMTGKDCFGEDTGLEVAALGGAPGVKSARYAGESRSATANMDKLLQELEGSDNREARFRTVIALIVNGKEVMFEGICKGTILEHAQGSQGFGYDPVFVPEGADRTFAEMSLEEKNRYSHRQKATTKLVEFLTASENIKI